MTGTEPTSRLYLELFPNDGASSISRLIALLRARKAAFIAHWHALCRSTPSQCAGVTDDLFYDVYVPMLRCAAERLARGDAVAFIAFAHALGERVAAVGLAFATMLAHVHLLKESCSRTLTDEPDELERALCLFDRLTSCLVGAAAESYYGYPNGTPAPVQLSSSVEKSVDPRSDSTPPHGIVGRSETMQRLLDQIERIAVGAAPVLVLGETGTGKELVTRALHAGGPRRDGPFIALNCAALPRDLIEAELFGYKRGAFSGAVSECLGLFRAANGGTLVLDEITEMGPDLQAKLLRVLQERTVRPVGSTSEEPVDVRIVASSNRDPTSAVAAGALRADLYYRLAVSTLCVPPLRERRDDIPSLVRHRLRALNERYADRTAPHGISADAIDALRTRPWPGNVRELFNVVENAFTLCASICIRPADLASPAPTLGPPPPQASRQVADLPTLDESERMLIEQALALTGGNKLRAALSLRISRKKLYAKIARYGLTN